MKQFKYVQLEVAGLGPDSDLPDSESEELQLELEVYYYSLVLVVIALPVAAAGSAHHWQGSTTVPLSVLSTAGKDNLKLSTTGD